MPIRYIDWVKRGMLRAQPNAIFVFGDNAERVGLGGQAGAMRGEPNALGIATLHAPGWPFRSGDPVALEILATDLMRVATVLAAGTTVFVTRDGIGTGIARLPEVAPELHRLIDAFFRAAPGEPCPWTEPKD